MSTQTGDIFQAFDEKTMEANFGKPLKAQDPWELQGVNDTQERLRRYKQTHADEKCGKCALLLREHSLREWQHCEAVMSHDKLVAQMNPQNL